MERVRPYDNSGSVWFLDLRNGEARQITIEENARMAMEWAKRCVYRNGVCYVDCEPPDAR